MTTTTLDYQKPTLAKPSSHDLFLLMSIVAVSLATVPRLFFSYAPVTWDILHRNYRDWVPWIGTILGLLAISITTAVIFVYQTTQ